MKLLSPDAHWRTPTVILVAASLTLTLAFGMLFYSFLFKFYHLTGGDSGMRIPRMKLLGLELAHYNKIELLSGPFH